MVKQIMSRIETFQTQLPQVMRYPPAQRLLDTIRGRADGEAGLPQDSSNHGFAESALRDGQRLYLTKLVDANNIELDRREALQRLTQQQGQTQEEADGIQEDLRQARQEVDDTMGTGSDEFKALANELGVAEANRERTEKQLERPCQVVLPIVPYFISLAFVGLFEAPLNQPGFAYIASDGWWGWGAALVFGIIVAVAAHLIGEWGRRSSLDADSWRTLNRRYVGKIVLALILVFLLFYASAVLREFKVQLDARAEAQGGSLLQEEFSLDELDSSIGETDLEIDGQNIFDDLPQGTAPAGEGVESTDIFANGPGAQEAPGPQTVTADTPRFNWLMQTIEGWGILVISISIFLLGVFLSILAHDAHPYYARYERDVKRLRKRRIAILRQVEQQKTRLQARYDRLAKICANKIEELSEHIHTLDDLHTKTNGIRQDLLHCVAVLVEERIGRYEKSNLERRSAQPPPNTFGQYKQAAIRASLERDAQLEETS